MSVLEQVKREGLVAGIIQGEARGIVIGQRKVALQILRAGISIEQVI